MLIFELFSDLLKIDDILFIIKSDGATSEIKSNSLGIRQKDRWITIGENDGPAHMHIDVNLIGSVQFIREKKLGRTSFSVRFFDKRGRRVLAAFFTKIYDDSKVLIPERITAYDDLAAKFASKIKF